MIPWTLTIEHKDHPSRKGCLHIEHPYNIGLNTRNTAIDNAKGEYLFLWIVITRSSSCIEILVHKMQEISS